MSYNALAKGVENKSMAFLYCLIYLASIGIMSFVVGRLISKHRFDHTKRVFCVFEREMRFYERIKIKNWQNKLPDMSRILPGAMPAKSMKCDYRNDITAMINETCVAGVIHFALCILGFGCAFIWRGIAGIIASVLYCIGNIPFIMIQRYNRPRLIRLAKAMEDR